MNEAKEWEDLSALLKQYEHKESIFLMKNKEVETFYPETLRRLEELGYQVTRTGNHTILLTKIVLKTHVK